MNAILFVPLLALAWILGFFVLAHAGHYFLSIVESSAVGLARNVPWKKGAFRERIRDGIDWPEESFHDFFWKGFHLLYLTTIWAGPEKVEVGTFIPLAKAPVPRP